MTDLAAEGDRLHAAAENYESQTAYSSWANWALDNWPAIAAALRERDEAQMEFADCLIERDALVAELAGARMAIRELKADLAAAHAAAVEGRP